MFSEDEKIKIIEFQRYLTEGEQILFLHFKNEDETEQRSSVPFYHKKSDIEIEKRLEESVNMLPQLIEQIYKMGLNQERIEFRYKEQSI
jgi:hypothetical protein